MKTRLEAELERCDREIAAMLAQQNAPAWLVTLGVEDWEMEKRLLLREALDAGSDQRP